MKKVLDYIGSGIGLIFPLFFFYGEIFGIIHSVRHHSSGDVTTSIFVPPWAWWRSIEMYWHDDYANVDWGKRLDNDLRSSVYFLSEGTVTEANQFELNENMEEFASKIKGYPKEKRNFIVQGSRQYMLYRLLTTKDIAAFLEEYYDTGKMTVSFSSETNKVKADLINTYHLKDIVEPFENVVDQKAKQLESDAIDNLTIVERTEMKAKYHSNTDTMIRKLEGDMKRIFKSLFNEEF